MAAPIMFDREKIHLNLARIRKGGEDFEVAIEPDLAIKFKEGKAISIREVLHSENVFKDAKKGLRASTALMKELFGTDDELKVAEIILKEGEIQLTSEYREKLREEKEKSIIAILAKNSIDPRTGLPHPPDRIKRAMDEVKVKINYTKNAEDQIEEIAEQLRPVLPLKFERVMIELNIPAQYAAKCYSVLKNFGELMMDEWQSDGSLKARVRMPAGLQQGFYDALNKITHGDNQSKIIKE